ncbi:STAS/SEC14 domain-containing protein [Allobacillus sp. GCM10007491]|uniref:STAS/SEC14 domain-containing protein n=1 Tax=Allobacillus saliphilus TaxID=2912308 RepID=A0A941CW48_9BACI|nr:STAS/SEC14 domain-containing protein [Allobacillus saliphilus]MBR7554764.1 STAS/SEC14 domain-containing protein [Allobacillus saliphilus]
MFSFLKSRDDQTIALGIEGKVSEEDAERLNQYVEENFGDDESFNIVAYMDEVESTSLKGALEGLKFDTKRWNQLKRFAMISDKNWVKAVSNIGSLLPGVETKHFTKDEVEEAWGWIMEEK